MKKVVVVYDDTVEVKGRIKSILGKKSFGEMILKRRSMSDRIKDALKLCECSPTLFVVKTDCYDDVFKGANDAVFIHVMSNMAIVSPDEFAVCIDKAPYVNSVSLLSNKGKKFGAIFPNKDAYKTFLDDYAEQKTMAFLKGDVIDSNIFIDLSDYDELLMYISGGFDARYFNSLQGDNYTVTKRSTDKAKMEAEYKYYWLLPEHMRSFMVMPYDFRDEGDTACYTMERMPMTDIAIRWTHGAVDDEELRHILDKTFYFFNDRERKEVSRSQYEKMANKLYVDKLKDRIKKLKALKEYEAIEPMIKSGTQYDSIDAIAEDYFAEYKKVMSKLLKKRHLQSVIGHGDVFFANMLYSKEANILRLIDPKGATKEEDLWTDPYYDIAKLSHSICGNYDFFNTGSYDIFLDKDMQYDLNIHTDNTGAKAIFREFLKKNDIDYVTIRIFEASLFLSMLPLHIDNPHKVFGFILNAINILEEVKNV